MAFKLPLTMIGAAYLLGVVCTDLKYDMGGLSPSQVFNYYHGLRQGVPPFSVAVHVSIALSFGALLLNVVRRRHPADLVGVAIGGVALYAFVGKIIPAQDRMMLATEVSALMEEQAITTFWHQVLIPALLLLIGTQFVSLRLPSKANVVGYRLPISTLCTAFAAALAGMDLIFDTGNASLDSRTLFYKSMVSAAVPMRAAAWTVVALAAVSITFNALIYRSLPEIVSLAPLAACILTFVNYVSPALTGIVSSASTEQVAEHLATMKWAHGMVLFPCYLVLIILQLLGSRTTQKPVSQKSDNKKKH